MRKSSKELPGWNELSRILEKEAKRKLPPGKLNVHYPDFSLVVKLFMIYGGKNNLFQKHFDLREFLKKAGLILDVLVKSMLAEEVTKERKTLLNKIYGYLSEEDQPQKSDLIFVFGSANLERVKKAVELYKKGLAPKILFSGHGPIYEPDRPVEAIEYCNLAIREGVPREAIVLEPQSITIPDNVRRSLNLLDQLKVDFKKVILVNSPHVQRRGWCHFKKYLPDKIKLFRVNCLSKPEYQRDNWFKTEAGIRIVLNEFIKMRAAVILNTA